MPPDIKEEMNQKEDAVAQLGFLCDKCAEAGLKIYLFIDEYDHFTNQILAHKEHENDTASRLTVRDIYDISSTQSREPQEIHWAEFSLQE